MNLRIYEEHTAISLKYFILPFLNLSKCDAKNKKCARRKISKSAAKKNESGKKPDPFFYKEPHAVLANDARARRSFRKALDLLQARR